MRKLRLSLLDYLPPVVAFVAAVAAVIGAPKWNPASVGLLKVTPFGWAVLAIGVLALTASISVTARNRRDQIKSRQSREEIAAIGKSHLLRAMNHLVHPMCYSSIWRKCDDNPKTPLDLLSSERRNILSALDLNSASPYSDGSFAEIKWHSMLERAASEGAREITTTLQIYSSYFTPRVMEAVTRVLYSDFLQFRLLNIHATVRANTHRDKNRAVPFFYAAEDNGRNSDYEDFWRMLNSALAECGAKTTSDGRSLFALR